MRLRPIIIGQAPGPNSDPGSPLNPFKGGSTGDRLSKIMGISADDFCRYFDAINLLQYFPGKTKRDDRWPITASRIAAQAVTPLLVDRPITILLGRNVARAFGVDTGLYHNYGALNFWHVVVPHPSGRNHWYRNPDNRRESQEFWRIFIQSHFALIRL